MTLAQNPYGAFNTVEAAALEAQRPVIDAIFRGEDPTQLFPLLLFVFRDVDFEPLGFDFKTATGDWTSRQRAALEAGRLDFFAIKHSLGLPWASTEGRQRVVPEPRSARWEREVHHLDLSDLAAAAAEIREEERSRG